MKKIIPLKLSWIDRVKSGEYVAALSLLIGYGIAPFWVCEEVSKLKSVAPNQCYVPHHKTHLTIASKRHFYRESRKLKPLAVSGTIPGIILKPKRARLLENGDVILEWQTIPAVTEFRKSVGQIFPKVPKLAHTTLIYAFNPQEIFEVSPIIEETLMVINDRIKKCRPAFFRGLWVVLNLINANPKGPDEVMGQLEVAA